MTSRDRRRLDVDPATLADASTTVATIALAVQRGDKGPRLCRRPPNRENEKRCRAKAVGVDATGREVRASHGGASVRSRAQLDRTHAVAAIPPK